MDSETLIKDDISEFYNMDFPNKSFIACEDYTSNPKDCLNINKYVNAGVLLINLNK